MLSNWSVLKGATKTIAAWNHRTATAEEARVMKAADNVIKAMEAHERMKTPNPRINDSAAWDELRAAVTAWRHK